jgi:hypothetical protein
VERAVEAQGNDGVTLSWRALALAFASLLGALAALHWGALALISKDDLDPMGLSDFYPISVFKLRTPQLYQLGVVALLAGCVAWLWPRLARRGVRLSWVLMSGIAFAVLSNGLHGIRYGLDFPTATNGDSGIEYYHDAIAIPGPLWLLERYNAIQFELLEHTRTHPPGPVLLYWLLHVTLREPALISIGISTIGLALTLPYLRRLLVLTFGAEPPGALTLFTLLPAILIYGLAVVDAPIAGLFLATVVTFIDDQKRYSWLWAGFWLFVSLFFTFGALFLLPVLVGFELLRRKRLRRAALALLMAATLLLAVKLVFGFDWLRAFLQASSMENPGGFLLFVNPRGYFWYRLGAVAEIALFFTPFLWLLWWRGRSALRRRSADSATLSWLGLASLAALLLSGALKIGEAARICLFILPYLFLPVAAAYRELDEASRARTVHSVAAFGVLMQLFGFYQW